MAEWALRWLWVRAFRFAAEALALSVSSANCVAPLDEVTGLPRPATKGSVSRPRNRFIASKVVCCDPVASSPESWVRFCGMLPAQTALSGLLTPPTALNAASSADQTARWLALYVVEGGGVALAGMKVPPLLIVVAPTVPVAVSVPPVFTVMVALAKVPLTLSVPPLMVQGIAAALVPVNVQVDAPILLKMA